MRIATQKPDQRTRGVCFMNGCLLGAVGSICIVEECWSDTEAEFTFVFEVFSFLFVGSTASNLADRPEIRTRPCRNISPALRYDLRAGGKGAWCWVWLVTPLHPTGNKTRSQYRFSAVYKMRCARKNLSVTAEPARCSVCTIAAVPECTDRKDQLFGKLPRGFQGCHISSSL